MEGLAKQLMKEGLSEDEAYYFLALGALGREAYGIDKIVRQISPDSYKEPTVQKRNELLQKMVRKGLAHTFEQVPSNQTGYSSRVKKTYFCRGKINPFKPVCPTPNENRQ